MMSRIPFVFALSGVLASCAHATKDQSFSVSPEATPSQAIDRVLETLAHKRLAAGTVDRSKGTVTTRWFDTGYRFREIDDDRPVDYYTDVFLRHRISLVRSGGKLDVTVSTDVQRCAPLDAVITATEVQGTCRRMDAVFPTQQRNIDRFVEDLRKAISNQDHNS